MMLASCPHEKEVRQLIAHGQWPAVCPPELRAHVDSCRACGDLVLVAEAFQRARVESLAAAQPVPAAVLLWRAQLRRRYAAVERMGRPLVAAEIFAFAVVMAAAVGFAGFEAHNRAAWATWPFWREWLAQLPHAVASQWTSLSAGQLAASGWNWMLPALVLATLALLGGAVYLAADKP